VLKGIVHEVEIGQWVLFGDFNDDILWRKANLVKKFQCQSRAMLRFQKSLGGGIQKKFSIKAPLFESSNAGLSAQQIQICQASFVPSSVEQHDRIVQWAVGGAANQGLIPENILALEIHNRLVERGNPRLLQNFEKVNSQFTRAFAGFFPVRRPKSENLLAHVVILETERASVSVRYMSRNLQHTVAGRAGLIIEYILVHCLSRQFRAGLANFASWNAHDRRVRGDILQDDAACADFGTDPHFYIVKYLGASGNQHA
jgi:hypothetical protein